MCGKTAFCNDFNYVNNEAKCDIKLKDIKKDDQILLVKKRKILLSMFVSHQDFYFAIEDIKLYLLHLKSQVYFMNVMSYSKLLKRAMKSTGNKSIQLKSVQLVLKLPINF